MQNFGKNFKAGKRNAEKKHRTHSAVVIFNRIVESFCGLLAPNMTFY